MSSMRILRGTLAITLVGMVVLSFQSVVAQEGERGSRHRIGDMDRSPGPWAELSQEQRDQLKALREEMLKDGATRQEIHDAAARLFEGWGLEMPELPPRHGPGPWAELSQEQRDQLRALREEMLKDGATRQEIRGAAARLFEEWGLEMPELPPRHGPGPWAELSQEQRQQLRETVKALRDSGATREQIRQAVKELLEEWKNDSEPEPEASQQQKRNRFEARNYPNPFNPDTRIVYTLEEPAWVSLSIYNTRGQLIRTLVAESQGAGEHTVIWNGLDQRNEAAPGGIYFYRLAIGPETQTGRMLLLK